MLRLKNWLKNDNNNNNNTTLDYTASHTFILKTSVQRYSSGWHAILL